jgi:thiol-disulfide isomerase/thioredoxin
LSDATHNGKDAIVQKTLVFVGFIAVSVGTAIFLSRHPGARLQAGPSTPMPTAAPEFPQGTQWLQSKPLTLASLDGQVVVVHFWTFGCINCVHNYPVYKAWQQKYAGKGVTIIGVHTPEFSHEADINSVRAEARANGLDFPIAIDNNSRIWKAWDNSSWPSIYLIDKKGRVRYHWDGELHLKSVEGQQFAARIDELLSEKP